jgi:hypothetical protein
MAKFGWAYINCSDTGSGGGSGIASGPAGALQFTNGTGSAPTGSFRLRYFTGSYGEHTGSSTLVLSGNMVITGTLSASVFNYENIAIIDATGSTFFGNTQDDRHSRTGSLEMWGGPTGEVCILTSSAYSQQTFVRGFGANYYDVDNVSYTVATKDHILGVTVAGNVILTVPSASIFGAGSVIVVKDEVVSRGAYNITLTCSAGAPYLFDGSTTYIITGTMPAISLYSNGTNWFVF